MPPIYRQGKIADFLFACGPGYWKTRGSYWIILIIAIVSCFTIIGAIPGICAAVFLFVSAQNSKAQWRHAETIRAINESNRPKSNLPTNP